MKAITRDKLNALAQIAAVDGHVADEEKAMIYKIAEEHGFSEANVNYILENPEPLGDFEDLSQDEKLEFMFMSLSIMQADDLVYNSEISFCKTIAEKLHIDPAIVDVYATRELTLEEFMKEAGRYVE